MDTAPTAGAGRQPAASAASLAANASRSTGAPDLQEMLREAREKAQARRDALQSRTPKRYGDAPIEAHARLARARTPSEAGAASAFARRKIVQLQAALRQDGGSADQIRAAIRQLKKAVARGERKKRDLRQEQLTEIRRAKAQEEQKRRKARQLHQELARSRSARAVREAGYVREAVIDSQTQAQLAAAKADLQAQAQGLASASTAPSEGRYGPGGAMIGGETASSGQTIDLQA